MGKILDSTNIKDSRYLFSQTPSDFQNDNYYLNSLQMKIDADWPYRPNRKWVEEENIFCNTLVDTFYGRFQIF